MRRTIEYTDYDFSAPRERKKREKIMSAYDNFQKVKEEIANRRTRARADADARNLELRAQSEELAEIDLELEGTGLKLFSAACRGQDISPLRERNTALMQRRSEIIRFLGYPEDYTEVHYTCKKCSDTGFIDGVKMCSCFKEALATENIKSSGIGKLIERQSFDNFDIERYRENPDLYDKMKYNLDSARRFAREFGKESRNLVLIGFTGTGKTHLSTAIAKEVITRGFDVVYDTAQNIVSDFEADRFKSGYGPYEPKAEKYLECELLIIDDLGTEFINQFSLSCLYNLINTRENRGLSTILSTNLSMQELQKKYEDRIFSRIMSSSSKLLYFPGNDQRLG